MLRFCLLFKQTKTINYSFKIRLAKSLGGSDFICLKISLKLMSQQKDRYYPMNVTISSDLLIVDSGYNAFKHIISFVIHRKLTGIRRKTQGSQVLPQITTPCVAKCVAKPL